MTLGTAVARPSAPVGRLSDVPAPIQCQAPCRAARALAVLPGFSHWHHCPEGCRSGLQGSPSRLSSELTPHARRAARSPG